MPSNRDLMSADPNKKTLRTFQCRDILWDAFQQMAQELECSIDYLVNESMKQYARQRYAGRGGRAADGASGSSPEPPSVPRPPLSSPGPPSLRAPGGAPLPPPPPRGRGPSNLPPPPVVARGGSPTVPSRAPGS